MKVESSDETILFDRELGRVVSSQSKIRIKGDNMTFSINGMELDGRARLDDRDHHSGSLATRRAK